MTLPLRDVEPHTDGDCLTWQEDQRCELIAGAAYAMAPAPTRSHRHLASELFRQIADTPEGGLRDVSIAPFDMRLPEKVVAMQDRLTSAARGGDRLGPGGEGSALA
jgi:hypothetical protein